MISNKEAAEVASRHGLGLSDAAALARMADTPDEAEDLAAQFSQTPEKLADAVYKRQNGRG